MNINKQPHKIDEKDERNVLYFNGEKWLVREFCKNKTEAKKLLDEIEKFKTQLLNNA